MLDAGGAQGPHGWVPGDAALGRHTRLRHERRERGERSRLGGPGTTARRAREAPLPASPGRGRRPQAPWPSVVQWRQGREAAAWTSLPGRDGAKGPGASAMVKRRGQRRIERQRTGPAAWLVVPRGPLTDARPVEPRASRDATAPDEPYRYPYSLTPTAGGAVAFKAPSRGERARGIKAGAGMEASCPRGQGEVGMEAYQGRTWPGWHHLMALSLMAVWCLSGEPHRGQQLPPAFTLPHVRDGLSVLLLEVCCTPGVDAICRQVQRQLLRNESARCYHHRTRKCIPPRKLHREIQ